MWRARLISSLVSKLRFVDDEPHESPPLPDDASLQPARCTRQRYRWPHRTTTPKR
jgi:hypothetical protein